MTENIHPKEQLIREIGQLITIVGTDINRTMASYNELVSKVEIFAKLAITKEVKNNEELVKNDGKK